MKKIVLSLSALAVMSYAQEVKLEEIEVQSSLGTEVKKKYLTESVTVITAGQIKAARINTLSEALNRLGNIATTSNGGTGKTSSMFVRGISAKRTLVMIDGIRYNDITGTGGAQIQHMMLSNVEQIEIVKGAQSGVWGADASGGVINIITKSAQKGLHGEANIEYGSFDTKIASLQASYATDDFDVLMGGSYFDSDNLSSAEPVKGDVNYGKRFDDLGYEKDKYTNETFNLKAGYNITENDRVEASLQMINAYTEYDASAGIDAENVEENAWGTSYYYNYLKNRFYTLSYKHTDSVNDISAQYNLSIFDRDQYGGYEGSVSEVKIDDKIAYIENSFIRFGASYQLFKQDKSGGTELNKEYDALSAFTTNYNKLSLFKGLNTIITESIRYDKYSSFDDKLTGKLGLKQFVYNDIYLSSNIGTGYNVPSLYQLYAPSYTDYKGDVSLVGNDALKPESTSSFEISIGNDILSLTGFYNEVSDFIDYTYDDAVTYTGGQYKNVEGTSVFKGIEIAYEDYFFDIVGVSANYTYLDVKDANGEALARRPKDQVDASVIYYATETFDLGLNGQYIGQRFNRANDEGAQTGFYTVINFVSNVEVNDFITVYGKLDNITNVYYQTVDGYATAGRSLYMGLNAKY